MDFEACPPDLGTLLRGGSSWNIFATGEVDLYAGERLQRLLTEKQVPAGSEFYLHSTGGSLIGGMNLGRVIRSYNLITHVGKKGRLEDGFQHTESGYCMSASALAFLGGEFRFVGQDSRFGVHRFTLGKPSVGGVDDAQVLSASVVEYIRSMGVETELFSLASDCPADDMLELHVDTLKRLNVVNNGIKQVVWTIESIEGAVYLKGHRETLYGMQKFLLVLPSEGQMYMYVIFDGGQRASEIMAMEYDKLSIDGEILPLQELRIQRFNDNGRINLMYQVTPEILAKLGSAKRIGYYLQHLPDAAMFVGYDNFPFEQGATKLPGLLGVYFREADPNELSIKAQNVEMRS